jgi:hypothetical protein
MVLTPDVSVSRKQSVRMKKSRASDASVGISASFFTDEACQAAYCELFVALILTEIALISSPGL